MSSSRRPFERHRPDLLEPNAVAAPALLHLAAHEHLTGPRVVGDPRGDVHRPAKVVAVAEDHVAGVDADAGAHVDRGRRLLDEVEPGQDGGTRVLEVEHDAVAEPLHRVSSVRPGGLVHQRRQALGQVCARLVAALLGERRVPRQVEKGDRGRAGRPLRREAELLQVVLRRLHGHGEDLVLEVPPAEPQHQLLAEVHEAEPHLPGDVAHLLVRIALLPEAGEDRRSSQLEIRRDDLEDVLAVDAGQARELVVVGGRPDLEKLPQGGDLVLAQPSVGLRLGDAELAQEAGDELRRAPDLGGQLLHGLRERRGLGQVQPEVLVGELALSDAAGDQIEVDSRVLERLHEAYAVHVLRRERAVLVVRDEDAQAD